MSFFSAFLYGIGVRQQFMDSTQLMLLRISALSGLVLAVLAVYGMVLDTWFLIRGREFRFLAGVAAYLMAAFFGILIAAGTIFIMVLAGGNRG